jgi:hypothetical protein
MILKTTRIILMIWYMGSYKYQRQACCSSELAVPKFPEFTEGFLEPLAEPAFP